MKKIVIIVSICLVLIAGSVLLGLYMIGDKIIDETIDMSIPTIAEEGAVSSASSGINAASDSTLPNQAVGSDSSKSDTTGPINGSESASIVTNENAKKNQTAVTVKKMNEVKEKVTPQDKISAAAMVMSRLSSSEISELKGMLSGGLTAAEKAKAKAIAYSHFSSQEIKDIKDMYRKYMDKK